MNKYQYNDNYRSYGLCDGRRYFAMNETLDEKSQSIESGSIATWRGSHVAILICTRDRPETLSACLQAISGITQPQAVRFSVIVGDNNDISQEEAISDEAHRLGLDHYYVHQSRRGYCHIRNSVLDVAEQLGPDILIFIDDDHLVEPNLLSAYLECFHSYDADVVHGSYVGSSRSYEEGRKASKVSTYNVAFRRRLIAPAREGGLGLRFDPRLNLTGREDLEFFREAGQRGARMIYSEHPRTRTAASGQTPPKSIIAYASACNAIHVERLRRGTPAALALFLKSYPLKGIFSTIVIAARSAGRRAKPDIQRSPCVHRTNVDALLGGLYGLLFGGIERPAAREGRVVPLTPAKSVKHKH